jgi:WD40 repeat protein
VRALAVANERLFSGSYDGTVKVWDVDTLACLRTLAGHTGPVRTLVYSGGHMFSGSYDKTVRPTPAAGAPPCMRLWGDLRPRPARRVWLRAVRPGAARW